MSNLRLLVIYKLPVTIIDKLSKKILTASIENRELIRIFGKNNYYIITTNLPIWVLPSGISTLQ